jgi:hypothetical protein
MQREGESIGLQRLQTQDERVLEELVEGFPGDLPLIRPYKLGTMFSTIIEVFQ